MVNQLWIPILFLLISIKLNSVFCNNIYTVGDLDAWGIPTSANKQVYSKWTKFHNLKIGDSLFFLYPPSQDSVIQVTSESFNSCNLQDPILNMNNGNSLFNITHAGDFYFVSGADGHCEKLQKLHISVYGNGSYSDSPAPSASAPAYPTVFGSIPMQQHSYASSPLMGSWSFYFNAIAMILYSMDY